MFAQTRGGAPPNQLNLDGAQPQPAKPKLCSHGEETTRESDLGGAGRDQPPQHVFGNAVDAEAGPQCRRIVARADRVQRRTVRVRLSAGRRSRFFAVRLEEHRPVAPGPHRHGTEARQRARHQRRQERRPDPMPPRPCTRHMSARCGGHSCSVRQLKSHVAPRCCRNSPYDLRH